MKILCASCEKLIGYKCPFCEEPLLEPDALPLQGLYMECRPENPSRNGPPIHTQILFSIQRMRITHEICEACKTEITDEDTANLQAQIDPPAGGEG